MPNSPDSLRARGRHDSPGSNPVANTTWRSGSCLEHNVEVLYTGTSPEQKPDHLRYSTHTVERSVRQHAAINSMPTGGTSWEQQETAHQQDTNFFAHPVNSGILHKQQEPPEAAQLRAAHSAYLAALQSDMQQRQQFQPPRQVHQQQQQQQQQLHQVQQQPQNAKQQQQEQKQQQQQQLLEQRQALAAYQAALGRPLAQSAEQLAQFTGQHQLHESMEQCQRALGVSHLQVPAQLPQQAQEQSSRKLHGSVALPCNTAQAQNVYKAFQWQKDAIEYADACNQRAAGLDTQSSEQGLNGDVDKLVPACCCMNMPVQPWHLLGALNDVCCRNASSQHRESRLCWELLSLLS